MALLGSGSGKPSAPRPGGRALTLLLAMASSAATAEVVLDGTLGPAGAIEGPDYAISADLGRTVGTNLFHSFAQFNLSAGEIATFSGPGSITNILSRVTGGDPSSIDGTIRSDISGANLFFVNPNGVIFGPHAQIDVSGAFHVSTADYVGLDDGGRFDARVPVNSTLTSAPPSAFGFLDSNPAPIGVSNESYLEVGEGETLAVVGGALGFGGTALDPDDLGPTTGLFAPGGRIRVVSVASPGTVSWSLSDDAGDLTLDGFTALGEIQLSRYGITTTETNTVGGPVVIRGGRLVSREAAISASNGGAIDQQGVGVDIALDGDLILESAEGGAQINSSALGAGDAADIRIRAANIELTGAADGLASSGIGARVFSSGDGADIDIATEHLAMNSRSLISAQVFGSGQGGDITIKAGSILIRGVDERAAQGIAFVSSSTFNTGDAGALTVEADRIEAVAGSEFTGFASQVNSRGGGAANAGDLTIRGDQLVLRNGAQINAGLFAGSGGGGDVVIDVRDVTLEGLRPDGSTSGIFSSVVGFDTSGTGGNIRIRGEKLSLRDGGQVNVYSESVGTAGNIDARVRNIEVSAGSFFTSTSFGIGDAGDIHIEADHLEVIGPSPLSGFTGVFSLGGVLATEAGDMTIIAQDIAVRDGGELSVLTGGGGRGGTIRVQSGELSVTGVDPVNQRPARISADTIVFGDFGDFATGPAGDVIVSADRVHISSGGEISALSTSQGQGGSLHIQANDLLLNAGGLITAEATNTGDAGDITIFAASSLRIEGGEVRTSTTASDGGDIRIRAGDLLHVLDGGITTSVAGGAGNGGNIDIDPVYVVLDSGRITANAFGGDGGNIRIVADNLLISRDSVIDASSALGLDGDIRIESPNTDNFATIARLPVNYLEGDRLIRERCRAGVVRNLSSLVFDPSPSIPLPPGGAWASSYSAIVGTSAAIGYGPGAPNLFPDLALREPCGP